MYRFGRGIVTNNVTIHPGESIIFVEDITAYAFRTWWGSNLPPSLQIVTYIGGGLGLGASSDEVNLWNAVTVQGNELTERIAAGNFAAAPTGVTFVYDPENPPASGILTFLDGHSESLKGTQVVETRPGNPNKGKAILPQIQVIWTTNPDDNPNL